MTIEKLDMQTPDMTDANVARIAELFPNVVTEGKDDYGNLLKVVDFDALKQELSGNIIEGPQERYRLDWPGKREAMLAANTPITKTLRPVREESVDFDTTKNLFIEGDNLDALKLLQETYLGKVKMIYIDPPYNTGKDFIYKDNFTGDKQEYLEESGQVDASGGKLVANPDSNGRYHSDWLSMMYPRLKLARNLLRDDGVIFISIDDGEVSALRKLCDSIFGSNLFVSQLVWKSRQNKDNRSVTSVSSDHEYILCYGKKLRGEARKTDQYKNPDNDPRGPWASANMVGMLPADLRPNCHYDLISPETSTNYGRPKMGWRYEKSTMMRLAEEDKIIWPSDPTGRPRRKLFISELKAEFTGFSSVIAQKIFTRNGSAEIEKLFDFRAFDFPKPTALLSILLEQSLHNAESEIVLDFFSGSASTADAVLQYNMKTDSNVKMVSVQLPENISEKSEAFAKGYSNIAELSKERIRRAGKKILEGNPDQIGKLDVGFRVVKIESSNMNDVYYSPSKLEQSSLLDTVEHIKTDRTSEDLLFQVMLDWGVDLSLPIKRETLEGKTVYWVGDNDLAACFDMKLSETLVKAMAVKKPLRAVFRDDGFATDDMKINASQLFKQMTDGHTDMKVV